MERYKPNHLLTKKSSMKKNFYLFISLIGCGIVLTPHLLEAQISQISVMPGHPNSPTIYQAMGSTYANFPLGVSMDVLSGSSIVKKVLISFAKNPDNSPTVATARITSMDGGITWGSYQAYGNDAAMTIRRRNGTMITFPYLQTGGPGTYNIAYHTSPLHSNGDSWLPGYPNAYTGTVNTNMNGHRSIIEDDNGDLYATCYQTDVKLIKSTNGGAAWTLVSVPFDGTQPINPYSEPALERCADGSWLMVARLDGVGVGMRYSRSTNKGLTWTTPAPLNGVPIQSGYAYDVDPHLQLMPNGVLVLSYGSRRDGAAPDAWEVCTNRVAFSLDHGATWTSVTNTFTGARTSGVAPGGMTTGYTTVIPVTAHRFLMVSDNGSYQHYEPSPSPNPFTIWGKFVDIVRTQQNRIDLKAKYAQSAITIMSPATTLTYTDSGHPEARTTGAFDGSTDYWSGALGTNSGVYQLDLERTYRITAIGLAMLYGKEQSASVEYSTDLINWLPAGISYLDTTHYALNYTDVTAFNARYIRVNVSGSGQIGLSELELYEASSTFENNAVAVSGNPHGILPTGYIANGTSATEYGFSVQESLGFQSTRALRLWDGSSNWIAGIKKPASPSNKKTLEFRCRIATLPSGGSFSISIFGTVSGVESPVFRVGVFASTAATGVVKYYNGSTWIQIGTATLPINSSSWKLLKIEANESADSATFYIDNAPIGTFHMYVSPGNATNLTGFGLYSNGTNTFGESICFDDINFYDPAVSGSRGVENAVSENIYVKFYR